MSGWRNQLYYGDNLSILKDHIADDTIDLIYLDPPFNSSANYNVLFKEHGGKQSAAQITAFEDTWYWTDESESTYHELITNASESIVNLMQAFRTFLGTSDMMAYLTMMTPRLVELHRILKDTGSIYLHCDPTASHYLKLIMDAVFDARNFRNEITWQRSKNPKGSQHQAKRYSPDTDTILFFAKSDKAELHTDRIKKSITEEGILSKYDRTDSKGRFTDGPILRSHSMGQRPNLVYEYKGYTPDSFGWRVNLEKLIEIDKKGNLGWTSKGHPYRKLRPEYDTGNPVGNCWTDISSINPQATERLGYPTQKPEALLERIITASSNKDDLILDPFCGCGTTINVAEKLHRKWIGIDITHLAISLIRTRLQDSFGKDLAPYEVIGEPKDHAGAEALALLDRYQFQWWAVGLVGARPAQDKKKGKDLGIDGNLYFFDDNSGKAKRIIISVKSGNIKSGDVRDLKGVMEREKAEIGAFITLKPATKDMTKEAITSGYYESPHFGKFTKIQILTIEDILKGKSLEYPQGTSQTFKKAERQSKDGLKQTDLF